MEIFNIITLYIFVVSIIYDGKYVFDFIINIKRDDPQPMTVSFINKILLLLSSSYIITYIISIL